MSKIDKEAINQGLDFIKEKLREKENSIVEESRESKLADLQGKDSLELIMEFMKKSNENDEALLEFFQEDSIVNVLIQQTKLITDLEERVHKLEKANKTNVALLNVLKESGGSRNGR